VTKANTGAFLALLVALGQTTRAEPKEGDLLDQALRAIKMTRSDLTLDTEYRRRDAFALEAVDELLESPLKLPDYTQALGEEVANAPDLRALVLAAALRLELEAPSLDLAELLGKRDKREPRWARKVRRALPPAVADEVVKLVTAAANLEGLLREAYADLAKPELKLLTKESDVGGRKQHPLHEYFFRHHRGVENVERANKGLFRASEKVQLGKILALGAVWAEAVEGTKERLRDWALGEHKLPKGLLLDTDTPAGRVVVTGSDEQRLEASPALLIDLGGDDTYLGSIGSGRDCTAVIELAGNDRYVPLTDYACGVGIHGCSVFFDCGGDDRYDTQDFSLGVGLFGVGIAVDEAGRDEYNTQEIACGAAALGIGVLIDQQGHDTYYVRRMGQAVAVTQGFGLLLDRGGNDAYFAGRRYGGWSTSREFSASAAQGFAGGIREYTSGGIALLLDLTGNDTYFGEAIAQGVGYWFAAGMLLDGGGNDKYHAIHYSQGSAFHFAIAGLFDNGGNDQYLGSVTCQGSGYDYSAGVQVDYGGNDLYRSDHLSSGSGGVTGMGFLFDNAGNDCYLTGRPRSISLGGGQFRSKRGFGCIGVFLDFGGKDHYGYEPCTDNVMWTRPQDGVGHDVERGKPLFTRRMRVAARAKPQKQKQKLEPEAGPESGEDRVRDAMKTLSNWRTKKEEREAALEVLKTDFGLAEPMLIDHLLAEPFYMSFGAAYAAIPQVGVSMVPALVKTFRSGDAEDRVRVMNMLGRLDDAKSVEVLLEGLEDENYRVRGSAALGLGRLGHRAAITRILPLLEDEKHTCRAWAAMALGMMKDSTPVPALVKTLGDTHYSVRTTASNALVEIGVPSAEALQAAAASGTPAVRSQALETLATIIKEKSKDLVLKALEDPDWLVRASACRAAVKAGPPDLLQKVKDLAEGDPDSSVRLSASQAVASLAKKK